jgi:hypothetical protein
MFKYSFSLGFLISIPIKSTYQITQKWRQDLRQQRSCPLLKSGGQEYCFSPALCTLLNINSRLVLMIRNASAELSAFRLHYFEGVSDVGKSPMNGIVVLPIQFHS